MQKIPSWSDYFEKRESEQVVESNDNEDASGVPMDKSYRDEAEYRKLLDFLKGKPNVATPVVATKETAKGWFVVDEQSGGFWNDNNWTHDTGELENGKFDLETSADAVARVVGGMVISASNYVG